MELLHTDCSMTTNADAQTVRMVSFVGEGGESIEVKLVDTHGDTEISDEEMILKAAATMVQVAAFLVRPRESAVGRDRGRGEVGRYVEKSPVNRL